MIMQTEEVKTKRKRIGIDPMKKFEKVEFTSNTPKHIKQEIKIKLRNWVAVFSETYFPGRIIAKESIEMIREAREYGIEIPENIKHIQ